MSYWVELHCDLDVKGCRNARLNYPMQHVSSFTRASTEAGLRSLESGAKRLGWHKLRDGRWACPECHVKHAAALGVGASDPEAASEK